MLTDKNAKFVQEEAGKIFGAYLKAHRMIRKVTLKELGEGLCTVSMLMAIERGEKSAGWLLRERLLDRVGVSSDEYESYLTYEEYNESSMQEEIVTALHRGEAGRAAAKLTEYAEKYGIADEGLRKDMEEAGVKAAPSKKNVRKDDAAGRLRRQFYLGMKGKYRKQQGASAGELAGLFGEAVGLTVPERDEKALDERILSAQEIDLLLEYGRCRPVGEALGKCQEILRYLSKPELEENNRVQNYPKAVLYVCHILLMQDDKDKYTKLLKLCNQGIELLRTTKRMYYLWELLELREQAIKSIMEQNCRQGEPQRAESLRDMLAETKEWRAGLERLCRQFHVSESWTEYYNLYSVQDAYYIGDVIRKRRKMLGISRDELCECICSLDTLRRLENMEKNTQPPIVRELCTRLGLSAEYMRTELVTADVRARMLEREIRYSANEERFEENMSQLEELKTLIDMSNNINRQWVLCTEGMAKYRLGQMSASEYEECLKEALECTLPMAVLELPDTQECYLTNLEMNCIYHYSMLMHGECREKAYRRMHLVFRLQREFEESGKEKLHIRTYELYTKYKATLLHEIGAHEGSKQCARNVISACLCMGRMNQLDSAWYNWMRNIRMLEKNAEPAESGEEWKKDLKCCLTLSRLCRNILQEEFYKEVIEKYT